MSPQRQLKSATILMIAGLSPLLLGAAFFVLALLSRGDAILMMAILAAGWLFALVVAAPAAVYSSRLARRHGSLAGRTAALVRLLVATALGLPALAYAGIALHMG